MHMADALLSPAVGGGLWAVTAGTIAWCARRLKRAADDSRVPLMGVLAAFIFAAQMINFAIPGTGSSGHLGGGLLLAILLGPEAGFLALASVLTVQALFFADGGLLALGCNIFNLGFYPCFVSYPLVYRPLAEGRQGSGRILAGSLLAAVIGLQLGAFSVVLETLLSGISELPFGTFLLLMQPIHLAIGLVEGLVTAAVVGFLWKTRPELLAGRPPTALPDGRSLRKVLVGLSLVTVLLAGGLSWFASSRPDGLEWALQQASGRTELAASGRGVHGALAAVQEQTAVLPDYDFQRQPGKAGGAPEGEGTGVAGLLGGGVTLLLAGAVGLALRRRSGAGGGGN